MQKLHFQTHINAPVEKVWNTMLEKDTYLEWTKAFNPDPDSHFEGIIEGDWSQGSEMRFIGIDKDGNKSGMVSRVKENRKNEYISVEHYGIIMNGVEDTTSDQVKQWTPAYENYTFKETNGETDLTIDIDSADEFADMFNEMWPKALARLKELCEQ